MLRSVAIVAAAALAFTIAGATVAEATESKCRSDSAYWIGAKPGTDAIKRVAKPIPADYKPIAYYPITSWKRIYGTACDRALTAARG